MHQEKSDLLYMDIAKRISLMSYAERKKVGAVIVKDNNIVSFGYNGTPTGWDNKCEKVHCDFSGNEYTETIPEVIHAEANCICKCSKQGISSEGGTLYVTLSPCYECAKLIIQAGIKRVVYKELYRNSNSIEFLQKAGINVEQLGV